MNYKLLALDVDGTLLNDHYQITTKTKATLARMKNLGMKIVLATGRGPASCYPLIEELEITDPVITHNGAVIVDSVTRKVSLEIGFKAEELLPIIQYCRTSGIHFDANTAFDMYIESSNPEADYMYKKFFVNPSIVGDTSKLKDQIVKFTLFGNENEMDQAFEEILPRFPEWSIIRSGETFIDVIHPKATKGFALNQLLVQLNINPEQVIAFGNYYNDLEMLQLAGLGVAMDNSPEQVKQLANRVTASNNEDGVALVLEELLQKR